MIECRVFKLTINELTGLAARELAERHSLSLSGVLATLEITTNGERADVTGATMTFTQQKEGAPNDTE